MKTIAIIQSSYIPWKGYFDIINDADIFVFLDDVQYTNRDWRNKNYIKSSQGKLALIVPVKGGTHQKISEVTIDIKQNWQKQHFKSIIQNYKKSAFFEQYYDLLKNFYIDRHWDKLSDMNIYMIKTICDILGVETEFYNSKGYNFLGRKSDKIVNICKYFNADHYISGPSAKNYIEAEKFNSAGIQLIYKDYSGYPEYPQLHPPFEHQVSILDLLFNCGPNAPYYIWGWRKSKK